MRALATLLGYVAVPLFLAACSGDQSPATAPTAPDVALSAAKPVALDPTHVYQFDVTCTNAAPSSMVIINTATTYPTTWVPCNGSFQLGPGISTPLTWYDYEIDLDSPNHLVCSRAGVTTTGTFKCKSQKYTATLTVTDKGVPIL
jgi:hypothetical protein